MHDPLTVAFELKRPWPQKSKHPNGEAWKYWPAILVVWHRDPERRGDDDSCGWSRPNLTKAELAFVDRLITNPHDNLRSFFPGVRDMDQIWQLRRIWQCFKGFERPWWRHPRWHVWHWRIQIPAVQDLKRWLFSRCSKCGGRFTWGYCPVSDSWNGPGPRWFRGEPHTYHHDCSRPGDDNAQAEAAAA